MDTTRTPVGIAGLDAILHGGLPSSRLYLLLGEPGTGKTTFALQFLMEGARRGETVLFITLSESADELQTSAASHGWDLGGIEIFELSASDQLVDLDLQQTIFPPSEVELTETTNALIETLERLRPRRIVFDTLSDLRMMAGGALTYRRQLIFLKQAKTDLHGCLEFHNLSVADQAAQLRNLKPPQPAQGLARSIDGIGRRLRIILCGYAHHFDDDIRAGLHVRLLLRWLHFLYAKSIRR